MTDPNDIIQAGGHEVHREPRPEITAAASDQALEEEEVATGVDVADTELRELADSEAAEEER